MAVNIKLPAKVEGRVMWCGPHALAVLASVSYERAYAVMLRHRRSYQRGYWQRRGVKKPDLSKVIKGVTNTEMVEAAKTLKLPKIKWQEATGTLAAWADMNTVQGVAYLVEVTGHFGVVVSGRFIDQHGDKPVNECWCARKQMKVFARIG